MLYKMLDGSFYNMQVPTYYAEDESELSDIPANAPAGTLVEINEEGNFHVVMKMQNGTWNEL